MFRMFGIKSRSLGQILETVTLINLWQCALSTRNIVCLFVVVKGQKETVIRTTKHHMQALKSDQNNA